MARKLGVWKRGRKVHVKNADRSHLPGKNLVDNTSCKVFALVSSPTSATGLRKFSLDAEVLDIGKKDCILGLS